MYDPIDENEPATEQQMKCLAQLGIRASSELSRKVVQAMIDRVTATRPQLEYLERLGARQECPIRRFEASAIITKELALRRGLPPTEKQEWFLRNRGRWRDGMTRGEAHDLIGCIKSG